MAVLIEGMEMPKPGQIVLVEIDENGDVFAAYDGGRTKLTQHKAVPVPPHGRLGDLDRLAKEVEDMAKEFPLDSIGAERYRLFAEFIKAAPTVIQASGTEAE